ncbi:superoxide dismutase family protein [Paenibacillus sp. GCM10028914]|uniref:superoxide dismutase family protein n=1 Tax=Paenibacillus sp. GCM10028914 TaxID=3273416 RepID=UPI00361E268B
MKKTFKTKHMIGSFLAGVLLSGCIYVVANADQTMNAIRNVAKKPDQPVSLDVGSNSESMGTLSVKLLNASGEPAGLAIVEQAVDGVSVKISVSGLTPGKHGFHVHENAIQSLDFKTAGGHFNPTDKHHGLENPQGSHVGDMPNLMVKQDGTAEAELMIQHATLEKDKSNSIRGRSLIIHAGEDDNKSDPAGNSGDRVIGGNIPK